MTRRWAGLVLVAVVLTVGVTLPRLSVRPVAGVAVPAPVPAAPSVGDCAVSPVLPAWTFFSVADPHTRYTYPQQQVARCSGARYGEVIAVLPTSPPATITRAADGTISAVSDPAVDRCAAAVPAYLRPPDLDSTTVGRTTLRWSSVTRASATLSAPTAGQRAAGQHWLACLVYLQASSAPETFVVARYSGTLSGALSTGQHRDLLGSCTNDSSWSMDVSNVACTAAHFGEIFARVRTAGGLLPRSALQDGCQQLVSRLSRRADLTADGRLTTQVRVTDQHGTPVVGIDIPPFADAVCSVHAHGSSRLVGSLVGLGDRPIPWA